MNIDNMITKRKLDRVLIYIKRSINAQEPVLPTSTIKKLQELRLWDQWCNSVMSICGEDYNNTPTPQHRRLALPKFIKRIKRERII